MKLEYHADTDSLSIVFSERPSVDSREISEAVVADHDAQGRVVGIDIDSAGNTADLERVLHSKLLGAIETDATSTFGTPVTGTIAFRPRALAAVRIRSIAAPLVDWVHETANL